jgi:hypothetical protein
MASIYWRKGFYASLDLPAQNPQVVHLFDTKSETES